MRRVMHHQPLEQYLLDRMQGFWAVQVDSIQVRRLAKPRAGCNWEIDEIQPHLSRDAIEEINLKVVSPAKASINLID